MSVNIRYPNITAQSEKEQLTQIKSYLHQLVEQLNYALPTIGSGESTEQTGAIKTYEVQGGEMSYYELRSLIIQELQKVERLFEQLSGRYVKAEELSGAIDTALEQAKESGEFDGKDGVSVTHKWNGTTLEVTSASGTSSADLKGEDGKTPVYGVDFSLTENDVNTIAKEVSRVIKFTLDEETGNLYYEYPDPEVIEDENPNKEVEE